MAKGLPRSTEKLRAVADVTHALADQIAELVKLRQAVAEAEEAASRKAKLR